MRNGHIKRITDNDIHSQVLEVEGTNVRWACTKLFFWCSSLFLYKCIVNFLNSTTYITCPADPKKTLGIKLPFLIMIIKNLRKYFTFEVQVGHACIFTPSKPFCHSQMYSYTREAVFRVLKYKRLMNMSYDLKGAVMVTQAFSLLWQLTGVRWQKCSQEISGK